MGAGLREQACRSTGRKRFLPDPDSSEALALDSAFPSSSRSRS